MRPTPTELPLDTELPARHAPAEVAPRASLEAATPWLLVGGMLVLYTWRLSTLALWDNDETTYAQIAREMLTTGDFITLHFRGNEWFCHPPLYFWMVCGLDRLIGFGELAARLPAALAGSALIGVTYLWGRRLMGHRAALWGALCLGLNFQMYSESRMALLDTTLHVFSFVSLLGATMGLQGDRRGFPLMFLASGLACLAKGPFGLVFPWLVLLPYLVWTRQGRRLLSIPWVWLLPALALGLTWDALEVQRHGRAFFDTVLVYFAIKRMTVQVQGQGAPYWVYLAIMGAGLFPWSCFVPAALFEAWNQARRAANPPGPGPQGWVLLLSSVVVPFVFFTIAETELPNYIVFAYPGACLLVGAYLDRRVSQTEQRRLRWPVLAILVMAAAFVLGMVLVVAPHSPAYAAAFPVTEGICGGFAVLAAVAVYQCRPTAASGPFPLLATGVAVFLLSCSTWLAPLAEPLRTPIKPLGEAAARLLTPADTLAMFGLTGEYGLTFYADHYVIPIHNQQQLRRVFDSHRKVLAVISQEAYFSVCKAGGAPVYRVARSGNAVLVSNQPPAERPLPGAPLAPRSVTN